jgi:hypothetical protein
LAKELSREEYEDIIKEKRHEELSGALKNIALSLSQNKDREIVAAIEKQTLLVEKFVETVSEAEKHEAKVDVEVNQEQVVKSIGEMGKLLLDGLREIKENISKDKGNKNWEFNVIRGYGGTIDKITATQK